MFLNRVARLKKSNQGVGLIEVLVSILVLSVGLLGLLGLQSTVVRFNQGALYQTRAAVLAEDIMDRLRANFGNEALYASNFNTAVPSTYTNCASASANCTTTQLATYDVATWKNDVARVLPEGKGQITITAGAPAMLIVTLQYDATHSVGATNYGQNNVIPPRQVSFRTVL